MNDVWPLLAVDAAYQAGHYFGCALSLVLILAGIRKCFALMRRPATSRLCVSALLLLLVSWLAGLSWNVALEMGWLPGSAAWAILLLTVPLLMAALVVAVVALALYEPQRFTQGRKQAGWTIALSVLGLLGAVGTHLAEPLRALADKVAEQARAGRAGEAVVKEEWNFSLTPPDASWLPQAPSALTPLACAAYRKQGTEIHAMVVAERSLAMLDDGLEPVVMTVKANLAAKNEVREQREEPVTVAGVAFRRLISTAWSPAVKAEMAYEHWVGTHQGYVWQVVIWGASERRAEVAEAASGLIRGFRILDPERRAPVQATDLDVERPAHGYATRLAEFGWQPWRGGKDVQDPPPAMADFAARTASSVVLVMPYQHRLAGGPPPLEALARAFLAELDFSYERSSDDYTTRTLEQPRPGLEITTEREVEDGQAFLYLFRIHQDGAQAWMVGGWTRKAPKRTLDKLREALDAIRLTPPVAAAAPADGRAPVSAQFMNQIGLWHHQRDETEAALRGFREASRLEPEDRTYLENITHALEKRERFDEALALMESAKERSFARDHGHLMRRAWLTLRASRADEATRQVLDLISDGYKQHGEMLEFINQLLDQEHAAGACAVADAYAKAQPEPRPRLWQAQAADRADEPERAAELLERLIRDEPGYLEAQYSLGELANRQGRHERALELAELVEKRQPDHVRLHLMRGWAHMGRKAYRDAKACFEKAAGLAPGDEAVQTALQEAAAALGQGSNREILAPIEPVPLPERLAGRLGELRALPATYGQGHHAAILLWSRSLHYTAAAPMRSTTRRLIRILNDEGADDFSTVEHTYDPLIERLHVNRVEVTDAEGRVVARAGAEDAYVLDAEDRAMATTDRTVHIQVPGLKAGHTLYCEITVERLAPAKTFPFLRHLFASSLPTRLETVTLAGEIGGVAEQLHLAERVQVTRGPDSLVYEVADAPLTPDEPYQQPAETWAPVLVLAGKGASWEELGRNYLRDIADRMRADPTLEAQARELTKGLTGVREKARALSAFVQSSVRYKAIEFGVRGQIPNPPALTLQQRYGDCKDQALLLQQLLQAAGVRAHLALVNTDWEIDPGQPSLDAFNHAIVHVPDLPETRFIDTTASHLAAADHSPYGLWGLSALVLDPERPVLRKIPGPAPGSGDVVSSRRLSLLPPDGLRVAEVLTLHGYYASGMRGSFSRKEPKARFQHAQELLDDLGNYRLEDFEFENLADPNAPAVLRLTYTVPNAVEERGGVVKLRLPCAWETDYLRLPFLKERVTPFRWNTPFSLRSEVNWDASLAVAADSLKALQRRRESRFGRWAMTAGSGLRFEFAVQPGRHPAADYAEFHALWSSACDLWLKEVTLAAP